MAIFNPELQTKDPPSFLGFSKGISQPDPDKSAGVLLTGLGTLLESGVKAADTAVKDIIDKSLEQKVDREREGQTGALEKVAGVPQAERVADYTPDANLDVLAKDAVAQGTAIPKDVESGLAGAESLSSASTSGKILPTYYWGRLNMVAKDLRDKYPGYRQYIDTRIAQMTGGNPANEYMSNLMRQINAGMASKDSSTEKLKNFIHSRSKLDGSAVAMEKVLKKEWGEVEVMQWANRQENYMYDLDRRKATRENYEGDRKTLGIMAGDDLDAIAEKKMANGVITLMDGSKYNRTQLDDLTMKISEGEVVVSDEEGQKLNMTMGAYRTKLYNDIYQEVNATDKKGNSIAKLIGPEETKKRIEAKLAAYDQIWDRVRNKDFGSAYQDARSVEAITSASASRVLNTSEVSVKNYMRYAAAVNKIGGPQAGAEMIKDFVKEKSFPDDLKTSMKHMAHQLAAQPNRPGKVFTLNEALENLRKSGIGIVEEGKEQDSRVIEQRKAYQDLLKLPGKISSNNLNDIIKQNIIEGSYGPGNENIVDMFAVDTVDKHGNVIPGKHKVFIDMTRPENTDGAWAMRSKDIQNWYNYTSWATISHGKIFGERIRNLAALDLDPRYKIVYNTDTQELSVKVATGIPRIDRMKENQNLNRQLEAEIGILNQGFFSMGYIAKKEGRDPNAYILELMTAQSLPASSGVAKAIMTAIKASREPPKETGNK